MFHSFCLLAGDWDLKALSGLAFQYGPFFFALLFLFAITRWAYQRYNESLALPEDNEGRDGAISTNRIIYLASFSFGVAFTIASVAWWWWHEQRPPLYVFRGTLSAITHYQKISSPSVFQREIGRPLVEGDPVQYRDIEFVAIQDRPFTPGQKFEIDCFKPGDSTTQRIWITYPGDADKRFSYAIGFDNGKYVIKEEAALSRAPLFFADSVVHAQEAVAPQIDQARSPNVARSGRLLVRDADLSVLASTNSSVGEKLSALRTTTQREPGAWLWSSASEPALITLLDLTRYRDEEVAYLAKQYLMRINVSSIIVQLLSKPQTVAAGREAFRHLDNDSAGIVLKWLASSNPTEAARLKKEGTPLQMVGTPSTNGDRYYVQARWNAQDQKAVRCLATAFNQELSSNRKLPDELALMKGRSSRLVYWYGKPWAVHIRERIVQCGGEARFTSPMRTPKAKD